MSFSPFGTMITVCVCFNSRVPLTVPSFTARPRSRYSKTLFIVFQWPAQEKDKSVSVRDATLLKRGRLAGFLRSLWLQPRARPPQVASHSVLQAGPLDPHLTPPPGSSGCQKLHRSRDLMDRVAILASLPSSCVWPGIRPPRLENGSVNTTLPRSLWCLGHGRS